MKGHLMFKKVHGGVMCCHINGPNGNELITAQTTFMECLLAIPAYLLALKWVRYGC